MTESPQTSSLGSPATPDAQTARGPVLVLASSSPYRRALLEQLGYPFVVDAPAIDETPLPGESPDATALRLAHEKARVVADRHPGAVVIGSDQVALCENRQLGKPGNHTKALQQLQFMRGKRVDFHTALCVLDARNNRCDAMDVVTEVTFRDLPDAMLEAYLHAETPYDVAGSAKVEGMGIALLASVRSDDPSALIGLPLIALTPLLEQAGLQFFVPPSTPPTSSLTSPSSHA